MSQLDGALSACRRDRDGARRGAVAAVLALGLAQLCAACSLTGAGAPTPSPTPRQAATPRPTPSVAGQARTVLTQLGLNIHAAPSTAAPVLAVAAQGDTLTVLQYQASGGGWFQVKGDTTTGWIVSDPTLTAPGIFTSYQSSRFNFTALYPQTWTFAEEASDVVFRPQSGAATIVVSLGASAASFGPTVPEGYIATFAQQEVVCGYTTQLVEAMRAGTAPASPASNGIAQLSHYAEERLSFDATHAMQLAFNYDLASDLAYFQDFYNSISFPYPLCQQPESAAPAPT